MRILLRRSRAGEAGLVRSGDKRARGLAEDLGLRRHAVKIRAEKVENPCGKRLHGDEGFMPRTAHNRVDDESDSAIKHFCMGWR